MSLLFMDGFDHYTPNTDYQKKGWSSNGGISYAPAAGSSTSGRRGSGGVKPQGYINYLKRSLGSNQNTLIAGIAHNTGGNQTTSSSYDSCVFMFLDGTISQISCGASGTGRFDIYRGSSLIGSTAPGVLIENIFQYIEIKVVFHASAGSVILRVNGSTVLTLSGISTITTSNAYANVIGINHLGTNFTTNGTLDDFYLCNASGTTNNDFLGDVRVDTLIPNSDGTYSNFTPSTGTSHYQLVDETTPNITDYNSSQTIGHRDSYNMSNLSSISSQTIFGLQASIAALRVEEGYRTIAPSIRSSTTNSDGNNYTLAQSLLYASSVFETDPNTSTAWTESGVNAMEAGVIITG